MDEIARNYFLYTIARKDKIIEALGNLLIEERAMHMYYRFDTGWLEDGKRWDDPAQYVQDYYRREARGMFVEDGLLEKA